MVDSTKACQGEYVNVDMIQDLTKKKLIITNEGSYELGDYGEKLTLQVEINGQAKKWSPNKDSCRSMREAYGSDTKAWVGYIIDLQIIKNRGKDSIMALPTKNLQKES